MTKRTQPVTRLCRYDDKDMFIRERSVADLMGRVGFTDVLVLDILGRLPSPQERIIVDAVLVGLIEHAMSPSAIAARLTYTTAPESLQGAVCAGLQGVGSVLVGSLENCAEVLDEMVEAGGDQSAAAQTIVERCRSRGEPVPGFGHPHFRPDDPRTVRLFELVAELGLPGAHVAAARALSAAVDRAYGKHLTMNSSMGMAAALREIDFPTRIARGLAIICRSAGLVAHIYEEMSDPAAWAIMYASQNAVPYAKG